MSPQAILGIIMGAFLVGIFLGGALALDERDRREERAAARSSRQEAARSSLPPSRSPGRREHRDAVGRALTGAQAGEMFFLELGGHRQPPGQTIDEWITDVLGPPPGRPDEP